MNTNLRGLQLFRQLCWQSDLGLSANAASARLDPVNHWIALRRSFSAQPAANLTSESPHVDDQQAMRQASVVAHESLLQALQQLINESRQDGFMFEEAKGSRVKQRELQRRRILEGFAPMKLLLSRNEGLEGIADQRVAAKWLKQIALECAQIDKLRKQYEKEAAQLKKVGKGSLVGPSTSMMQSWYDPLLQAIRKEHEACMNGEKGKDRTAYGPYLYELEPEDLAVMTMHGVLGSLLTEEEAGTVKLTRVAMTVGKMVNEQIGAENMKRRVEVEHKRQRRLGTLQQKMWKDFTYCQKNGYDWEPRRAQFESQLNDIQAQEHIHVRDDDSDMAMPDEFAGINGEIPQEFLAGRVRVKADQLSSSSLLSEAALQEPDVDPETPAYLAKLDWFKADPKYEARRKQIRKRWSRLTQQTGSLGAQEKRFALGSEIWEPKTVAKVGVVLTSLLVDTATVDVDERDKDGKLTGRVVQAPAFSHALKNAYDDKGKGWWKKFGMITMHDSLMSKLSDQEIANAQIARWIPMVIPPREWLDPGNGGYLSQQPLIMRVRGGTEQRKSLWRQHAEGKMQTVYDALNAMGKTAWSINRTILERVEHAYRELKGGFVGLPLHGSLDIHTVPPPLPNVFRTSVRKGQLTASLMEPPKRELLGWRSQVNKAKKKNREIHSLRCDLSYKLEVANDYVDEEAFYYPHNLDFRGRAYPMHPSLNHLGADMSRGLLQFSEAKPLGAGGLRWLEISVANLYGKGADKLSFDDRVQFARDHMHEVFDSADNPFNGSKWWQQADSPWQLLAVCYDLQAALSSGDPESYCSKLPVHQDGSCNGLQHYAALGRDEKGGRAVNLLPVDKPQICDRLAGLVERGLTESVYMLKSTIPIELVPLNCFTPPKHVQPPFEDVYSEIASLVRAQVDKDAAAGVPEALVLQDNVDRKLVKQTVMTSVYGVTFVGARQQISSRLAERGWDDERLLYKTSTYGARITLASLHQMFDSAKDIMQWLSLCARAVAKADHAVRWTTPLGLPVVQPYRKKNKSHVQTLLQRVILVHQADSNPIQRVRQRTAFPPNFIHCLDSSHMMLTAIDCDRAGLSFAGVHDSFWTHAGSVDTMNRILREKFYELHSQPLLENLRNELQDAFEGVEIPEVPQLGALTLDKITEADYFFN